MVWRFKDQTMSFDLGDDFVFNKDLARALIDHRSPIHPLSEHFLLLDRLCFSWGQGDRDWPVICMKRGRVEMSLREALKVPNFNVLGFDLDEQAEGEVPLMKQVAYAAQEIQPLITQNTSEPTAAKATSSILTPTKGAAGSSGSQAGKKSISDDVDSDPEGGSRTGSFCPDPYFSGGFLPVNEVESMETENLETTSKEKGKTHREPKVVTFSGTTLYSSLGPDRFIDDEEDQVSSLPRSWFGPELMSFSRYADVFSNDMEIDPAIAEEKFIPDWDIRIKIQ
ncbi:hypothetical protein Hdeb2414_s0016g00476801 [Helianthus debilis subsp. tardiflorus]